MIARLKLIAQVAIGRAYYWFWHDLLCRQEPFTYQLARNIRRNGAFFWAAFILAQWAAYWHFMPAWPYALAWLASDCWLIDHLIDYLIDHRSEISGL
ncbi:hypothetical protein Dform_00844 [Dehalogenimonas formicexedens]|uniref:Uncharacterized protein n=1 Tax=Dehalogenimonas formicexedens TaxID=1839801 RepID=A0A1P8F6T3_9CHLR|nr:hypothetical protein Dform_00844 [Dehalogenimonas formicexedens]